MIVFQNFENVNIVPFRISFDVSEYRNFFNEEITGFTLVIFFSKIASVVKWSEFLATDPEVQVRFLALPYYQKSSGSGTGSTQPREYN
jgi:hypothetical protein